jgi:hypothetical protein
MLRLWSQAARPQLSCTCAACSSSVTGTLARRTASATTRRQVKLVDAFTILLAPVFATAFIADAIQKDRRRIEWDRRIAQVEGEVQRLQQQESQILRSLSSAANARRNKIHHTRPYCTDVRSRPLEDDLGGELKIPQWRTLEWEGEGEDDVHHASARDAQQESTPDTQMTENTRDARRRVERLVALKLAIRMLLHVRVGTSPRFNDINLDYTYEANDNAKDFNDLIDRLKTIRRSLHELNSPGRRSDVSTLQKMPRREQAAIDQEIRNLAHEFRLGNLSITRLVKRIGNSIIRSPEPPSVNAYVPLMTTLSRARLDELAYLVMAAMDESRLTLSNHSVLNIIWQYGKNRDANRFEEFLKSVTKASATTKYTELWEWRMINEVEVPCPSSNDSRLLQILVYTALKCNQPHRAEAWLSQLKCSNGPARHTSHVLRNFMKFYATNRDWQRGRAWLSAALDWSVSLGPNVVRDLQRVVFAMLELCVACGKQDAYTCILQAAVSARVGVFRAEADLRFTERSKSILAEWERLHSSAPTAVDDDLSSIQRKAQAFCDEVTPKLGTLGLTEISRCFEWPTPRSMGLQFGGRGSGPPVSTDDSATKWRVLYLQQATELERVKAELAELDWLRFKIARSEDGELESQAVVSPLTPAERSRQQSRSSSSLDASRNSRSNSLGPNLISSSTQQGSLPPLPILAATSSCGFVRETDTCSADVSKTKSDLEQNSAAILLHAADSMPRGDAGSGLEVLVKARTTRDKDSSLNKEPEGAGTQEGPRHERTVESKRVESSPYPDSHIPQENIQSNAMSEFRPLAAAERRRDGERDHFQERDAYNSRSDVLSSPIDPVAGPVAENPGSRLTGLVGEAADEPLPCSSTLPSATPTSVPEGTAERQSTEPLNPTRKAEWTGFLKMPSEGKLSARAALRYMHVGKPTGPKPVEHLQEQFVRCKDRATSPYIVLRLGQLPPPKAVKWVNGEFRPRKWITAKAEASAARTPVRLIYNGQG